MKCAVRREGSPLSKLNRQRFAQMNSSAPPQRGRPDEISYLSSTPSAKYMQELCINPPPRLSGWRPTRNDKSYDRLACKRKGREDSAPSACPAAPEGEWQSAAYALIRTLRVSGAKAEDLLSAPARATAQLCQFPDCALWKYRDRTVRWIVEHDPSYVEWVLHKVDDLSPFCGTSSGEI